MSANPAVDYGTGIEITCEAAAALTRFSCVVLSAGSNGYPVATATASTTAVIGGYVQDAPTAAGQLCSVRISGTTLAIASGAIAPGVAVGPSGVTAGRVTTSPTIPCGRSINPANAAAGELFPVLITLYQVS